MAEKIPDAETVRSGLYQSHHQNSIVPLKTADGETYISNAANCIIRLGRDRYGGVHEGEGAKSKGQCGAIDLCAGLVGLSPKEEPGPNDLTNLDFTHDAARVYISQRCHIDKWFGLPTSSEISQVENRSAVAMIADQVRVIGKSHIKIVTGKPFSEGKPSNSLGGDIDGGGRIDLITGGANLEPKTVMTEGDVPPEGSPLRLALGLVPRAKKVNRLQPIPRGENLKDCLEEIIDLISSLRTIVEENTGAIQEIALGLSTHFHSDTPQPIPGVSIIDPALVGKMLPLYARSLIQGTVAAELHKFNQKITNLNYLDDKAPVYILSNGIRAT